MSCLLKVAACQLNQWVLDFDENRRRIVESIHQAKAAGATLRVGPELEVPGYGCLDHFLENDVYIHSWEKLADILQDRSCDDILLDIGMPVIHRNCRYNCRVLCLNGKILLIRPKLQLANSGNYREMRYFTPWMRTTHVEEYYLPPLIQDLQGSRTVPIGDAVISTPDTCIGAETCEELWTPRAPHIDMSLNGVEIITNSSGSHHSLRKLHQRIDVICEGTRKSGGVYIYTNQRGGDGDRLYYDGCAMIIVNGKIVAQASQFGTKEVETIVATVDLQEVRAERAAPSRAMQAIQAPAYQRIETEFSLSDRDAAVMLNLTLTPEIKPKIYLPEEEIAYGPGSWLWDYLRRSNMGGFLLPLSGGIDSCSTALIVFSMCKIVIEGIESGDESVIADIKRIGKIAGAGDDWVPKTPQELCNRVLYTVYLGMEKQSSVETRERAKLLSKEIGSYHTDVNIDSIYEAQKNLLTQATGYEPKFKQFGGTNSESLALQNIQSRSRMVSAYYFAQMLPSTRTGTESRALLVLGSSNGDETLRGYYTKYDCSSADINPIGSISKIDLRNFVTWAQKEYELPILEKFLNASPTAELEPITDDYVQSDEADMGMTYKELADFGVLRKMSKLGPFSMFIRLCHEWKHLMSPAEVAKKVKDFHHYYNINRHKTTTLTPSYHASDSSPDDNRFDLRPFLYPSFWTSHQSKLIDKWTKRMKTGRGSASESDEELAAEPAVRKE